MFAGFVVRECTVDSAVTVECRRDATGRDAMMLRARGACISVSRASR